MDRDALIGALQRTDSASQACSAALAGGADFEVSERSTAIADLLTIYQRRARHVQATGLEHGGFDQALADLEASGSREVRLGAVTDRTGQRHYQLFVSVDSDDVVACLWVHRDQ